MAQHHATPRVHTFDEIEIRRAAIEAGVDVRTLRRALAGETVRGMAGARAMRAVARLKSPPTSNEGPRAA